MGGEKKGMKALEVWCRQVTHGYKDVYVSNMTTAFRDGLVFCALIHHFRPDLVDFESLCKENIYHNNNLAFSIAEQKLGIPALLDAEDMVQCEVPDRLSIMTYVSQFYNYFEGIPAKSPMKRAFKEQHGEQILVGPPDKVKHVENNTLGHGKEPRSIGIRKRPERCAVCENKVYILERLIIENKLYHRTCFKCTKCKNLLKPGSYVEGDHDGTYECVICPHEERAGFDFSFKSSKADTVIPEEKPVPSVDEAKQSVVDGSAAAESSDRKEVVCNTDVPTEQNLSYEAEAESVLEAMHPSDDEKSSDSSESDEDDEPSGNDCTNETEMEESEHVTDQESKIVDSEKTTDLETEIRYTTQSSDDKEVVESESMAIEEMESVDATQEVTESEDVIKNVAEKPEIPKKPQFLLNNSEKASNVKVSTDEPLSTISAEDDEENVVVVVTEGSDNEATSFDVHLSPEDSEGGKESTKADVSEDFDAKTYKTEFHTVLKSAETTDEAKLDDNGVPESDREPDKDDERQVTEEDPEPVAPKEDPEPVAPKEDPEPVAPKEDPEPVAPIKEKPASLNPFGSDDDDDDEEESAVEPPKPTPRRISYPSDSNPFGDCTSDEDEECNKQESTNPFGDPDEEEDDDPNAAKNTQQSESDWIQSVFGSATLKAKKSSPPQRPIPLPRGLMTLPASPKKSPSPGTLSSRKKKRAPLPPSQNLVSSPRTTPKPSPPPRPSRPIRKKDQCDTLTNDQTNITDKNKSLECVEKVDKSEKSFDDERTNSSDKLKFGYWKKKRKAPPIPGPMKRQISKIPSKEIQRELDEIEDKQLELELAGVEIEKKIRDMSEEESNEEEDNLVMQLFELVNKKNELFRRQADLTYLKRQNRLEDEHMELEYQIRLLMQRPAHLKTDYDKSREEELIAHLMEVVQLRNDIIDSQERDRQRIKAEEEGIEEELNKKSTSTPEKEDNKKSKKEKKKKLKKQDKGSEKKEKKKDKDSAKKEKKKDKDGEEKRDKKSKKLLKFK